MKKGKRGHRLEPIKNIHGRIPWAKVDARIKELYGWYQEFFAISTNCGLSLDEFKELLKDVDMFKMRKPDTELALVWEMIANPIFPYPDYILGQEWHPIVTAHVLKIMKTVITGALA